jgi:hypothetical protein
MARRPCVSPRQQKRKFSSSPGPTLQNDSIDPQPHHCKWGDAMDGTEFGRVELATSSIFGLKRRLPYNFRCRCGRTIRITQPVRFRFVCLCGLNHTLRDSEFD